MKLILKKQPDPDNNHDKVSVQITADCVTTIDEFTELLDDFMRACGMRYEGHLVIDTYDCDSKDLTD